jgi:flavodoxin
MGNKPVIVVYSYHHMNTIKVANEMAKVLVAEVINIDKNNTLNIDENMIIGFGSGIDSSKHYPELLKYVDGLKKQNGKRVFIFSTSAIMGEKKVKKDHEVLREKLVGKGFNIIDEFSCKGFNTNSFIKIFGGLNKGRPNNDDLKLAESFAKRMREIIA